MSSPSQFIIQGILSILQEKNMTTGALAKAIGKNKKEIKNVLSGKSPLTVDDLSLIGATLEISDRDLQQFMPIPEESTPQEKNHTPENEPTPTFKINRQDAEVWTPNPVGTHSEQALKLGFALGCNLFFVANTEHLQDSGIPEKVLKQFGDKIPIRLDSDFFHHYRPEYFEEGVEIRLSFDAVYTCFFPWHTLEQVTFFVQDDAPEPKPTSSGPTLRIVD